MQKLFLLFCEHLDVELSKHYCQKSSLQVRNHAHRQKFLKIQAMERNGDVATEFNNCHSENFCLNTSLFQTGCDKMCKDDNSESLFCKMRSDNVMTSGYEAEHEISISALKNQCLEKLSRSETDFVNNDQHLLSMIHPKTEDTMDECLLPVWGKNTQISGSPLKVKQPENFLLAENSLVNGDKIMNYAKNSFQIHNSCINSNAALNSDSSLGAISDGLHHTIMEEFSSPSIEEISVSSPAANDFSKMKRNNIECSVSKNLFGNFSLEKDSISPNMLKSPPYLASILPKLEKVMEIESSPKGEMPELIPTIWLDDDDDDESVPFMEPKSCEKVNVADSPEMPKLVPFSSDLEDIMKIKKERLDSDEIHKNDSHQLLITAKRKLFIQDEADSKKSVKKSKPDIQLTDCVSKSSSPETFTLEDSMSYQSGGIDSEIGTPLSKDSERFPNPDFRDFFSEMNRNLKLLNENNKRSEDNESQSPLKLSHKSEICSRQLSLDSCLLSKSADKPALPEASAIEGGENENKFSFKHCLPSNDSDDNDSLTSKPECQDNKNSSNEGPEIEEIEGVRFFQFRSKLAMEEFYKIPPEMESSVDMIVPTKTTDITQIKGWRNKYFASDSQVQFSCAKSESNIDECSQNAVSLPPLDEQADSKCVDFCIQDNDAKLDSPQENKNFDDDLKCLVSNNQLSSEFLASTPKKADPDDKKGLFCSEVLPSSPIKSDVVEKDKLCSMELKKSENPVPTDPMSAFVSKKLDDFLLNSSSLNINFLQKLNPNVKSIPPDAPILSIGKLRITDHSKVLFKPKFFFKVRDDRDEPIPANQTSKNSSASVITLSSSDEATSSSDDDIPVADLYSKVNQPRSRPTRLQPNKCIKRRTSDSSTDLASQRVVLRLTKQSRGTTEGYKVSEISVEKEGQEESASNLESEETLPDVFKKHTDGSLSTIKDGIFLKETEPKLLEEFLNNLNMYGTSKDVAMLVQSNQSYFVKGPVVTAECCTEALDALASNKEFVDLKNKATPKKKLKTWQKYLPKKLSKTQQQQISFKASHQKNQNAVSNVDLSERSLNAKEKTKQTKYEEQLIDNKVSQPLKPGLLKSKNLGKVFNSKDGISKLDNKDKFPSIENAGMKKKKKKSKHLILQKRRRKSKLNIDAQLALIERGKRSIRLPARYLDSAVLAAGTEWVSPIFVDDEKKSRKQLLDVLDKITPSKEIDTAAAAENSIVRKKSLDSDKLQKRNPKESVASKKQKVDNAKQNVSNVPKNLSENASSKDIFYPMPHCTCSPCSRTASFHKVEKSFSCFSEHNRKKESLQERPKAESISKERVIKTGRDSPEITITKVVDLDKSKRKESDQSFNDLSTIKMNTVSSGNSLTGQESNQNKSSISKYTALIKNSLSSSSMIMTNESYHTQSASGTKIVSSTPKILGINSINNKSMIPNMRNSNQNLNVSVPKLTNKVLLIVPSISSTQKSSSVPILQNPLSIQKVQKLGSESRAKPPILARKTVPENQISSSKNVLVPSLSLPNNNFNPNSVVLKLSSNSENADKLPLLYGSSLNSTASVLGIQEHSKLISNASQQNMSLYKAIQFPGNVLFCTSRMKSSPLNSNLKGAIVSSQQRQDCLSTAKVQTLEKPVNNMKVPILQADSLNSNLLETGDTNVLTTPQKSESGTNEHHHNYHRRQSSEHRRKSPLSKRKFHDSSDSEVDVDTIDQDFDAVLSLKQHYAECDADVFDNDCTFTFLSDLSTLLSPHKRKTISERNRRQFISNMSDKLRKTSQFFQNAKSLAEILNRASTAVHHLNMQNESRVIAKKILQYRNAQLLKKLSDSIQAIPDPKTRVFIKKRVIQTTARAWQRDVKDRKQISSLLNSDDCNYSSSTVEKKLPESQGHFILNGSQTDSEIEETPNKNNQNNCQVNIPSPKETETYAKFLENENAVKNLRLHCETVEPPLIEVEDNYVIDTDITEQPHVQLRILEASPIGEEMETSIQIKEKEIDSKTAEVSHEEPSSAYKAKRRLQFRASSDANTSDDDHLVIDLSDDDANPEDASSPQKEFVSPASTRTVTGNPPVKKFPGLIPLFEPDFLEDRSKLETTKPCLVSRTKSADSGANEGSSVCDVNQKIVAQRTSIPGLVSIQPVGDKPTEPLQQNAAPDVRILEGPTNFTLNSANKTSDSFEIQTEHIKNGETPSSLGPQTCISNKSCSVNDDIPRLSVDNSHGDTRLLGKLNAQRADDIHIIRRNVPEEIVIDDSDDEIMEIEDLSTSRTSKSPVQHSHPSLSTEKESQIHS